MNFSTSLFRWPLFLALAVASAMGGLTAAMANERTIRVDLDYARIVKIPAGAQTLVIGNPLVADVTMLRNSQLMVITGKSFGSTNLIVLDRTGAQVGESIVTVVPAEDKLVLQRGPHHESYSCQPKCAPTINLADDAQYMTQLLDAAKEHEGHAAPPRK